MSLVLNIHLLPVYFQKNIIILVQNWKRHFFITTWRYVQQLSAKTDRYAIIMAAVEVLVLCWRTRGLSSTWLDPRINSSSSLVINASDSLSFFFPDGLLIVRYLTLTFSRILWPLRRPLLLPGRLWLFFDFVCRIRKLSVTQKMRMFTTKGITSITTISSIFGLAKGLRTKSFTFSQASNWIIRVVSSFTITIRPQ